MKIAFTMDDLPLWPLSDLGPKFPPALRGVVGFKSVTLGGHLVHHLSLQEFHRRQVS